jgi:hypothetical protein
LFTWLSENPGWPVPISVFTDAGAASPLEIIPTTTIPIESDLKVFMRLIPFPVDRFRGGRYEFYQMAAHWRPASRRSTLAEPKL